ncbi:MAG: phage major capsid protein [Bacteroidota bacterium]
MSEQIIAKLDEIEANTVAKIEESKAEAVKAVEEAVISFDEKVAALEAKVSQMGATPAIKTYKSIGAEVNRMVKEQLKSFVSGEAKVQKEIKMFEDAGQYDAYFKEASALTGSGAGIGGRTAYDPVFVPLRLLNPMRGVARSVATDGSTYQFRAKVGDAGAAWGYAIQNNGSATTENTNIWQLTLQDLNVQFPIRTAALDDIDGLEGNVVSDMLAEFSQAEALSMIQNNDQGATSLPYGGSNGLRGLNQYAGANASYTGGTTSVAAFGTSGTGSTSGLHSLATYDQLTTNAASVTANNITYKDVINFIYALPQQYWTESAKFVVCPLLLQAIRGLVDSQGRPIYVDGLSRTDGIVGQLLGFDVVVNKYLSSPNSSTATAGTTSLYPMYFGDWQKSFTIVDRLNMILRRYDQTLPGSITFYGEKRLATSVVDPNALVRYRSTATAT